MSHVLTLRIIIQSTQPLIIGTNQSFRYYSYSLNPLSWNIHFSLVASIYLHILLSTLSLNYSKQCARLSTYFNILLLRISLKTMPVVDVYVSTNHSVLYHHLHWYLPHPLLICQTLRVGVLLSLILYILVCLQLKYCSSTLVFFHDYVLSRTKIFSFCTWWYFHTIIFCSYYCWSIFSCPRTKHLCFNSVFNGWFGIPFRNTRSFIHITLSHSSVILDLYSLSVWFFYIWISFFLRTFLIISHSWHSFMCYKTH